MKGSFGQGEISSFNKKAAQKLFRASLRLSPSWNNYRLFATRFNVTIRYFWRDGKKFRILLKCLIFNGTCKSAWAKPKAVVAVVVDKELKVLQMAEKAWRSDHLQAFVRGRLLCQFH